MGGNGQDRRETHSDNRQNRANHDSCTPTRYQAFGIWGQLLLIGILIPAAPDAIPRRPSCDTSYAFFASSSRNLRMGSRFVTVILLPL